MTALPLDVSVVALPSGVRFAHSVEFATIEGFRPLVLDLHLPPASLATAGACPVVVYFHGGGWAVGTRRRFGRAFRSWSPTPMERIALAGLAIARVDYRLSGEAIFPAQLDDALAAVRWVKANADGLGLAADRVVAWGESAGGHLAAMVGLTADDTAVVRGVIDGTRRPTWCTPAGSVGPTPPATPTGPTAGRRASWGHRCRRRPTAPRRPARSPMCTPARRRSRSTTATRTAWCPSNRARHWPGRCGPWALRWSW